MSSRRWFAATQRDLLFRGRGADIGTRAPAYVVRLAGAAIALSILVLAEQLGITAILGVNFGVLRVLVMVAGALLATTRIGAWLWYALGSVALVLMVVMYTPLVQPLAPKFVRVDNFPGSSTVPVVFVMSGGMNDDGRLNEQALDRLLTAVRIVKERQLPHLVLSVTSRDDGRTTTEADQRALVELVVPQTTLHFVHDVHSTYDEALMFSALARTNGWTEVAVLTSPLHTSRACAAFEAQGLRVTCLPSEPRDYSTARLDRPENRRKAFADVLYETAAWLWYRVRGWV